MAAFGVAQQPTATRPELPDKEEENRLPNGKSQRDEILKSEYDKSLKDAAELQRLSNELRLDLEKATAFVMPVEAIKKTEEIEKIAKRIRGRLKRS
jgi:hypothetical protein